MRDTVLNLATVTFKILLVEVPSPVIPLLDYC